MWALGEPMHGVTDHGAQKRYAGTVKPACVSAPARCSLPGPILRELASGKRAPQPLPIRLCHWVNVVLLVIMAGSGLQIFAAFPALGPKGATYDWYPFAGWVAPAWARIGAWLAGGRHWHFAFGWLFALNGAVYVGYLFSSGEWRRRLFLPRRDARSAVAMALYYVGLRRSAPERGLYNGLQRLAYTGALILAIVSVGSGLSIYEPVQLGWLAGALGGYDTARAIHLVSLAALTAFTIVHLVLVALHPRAAVEMLTGGVPEDRRE